MEFTSYKDMLNAGLKQLEDIAPNSWRRLFSNMIHPLDSTVDFIIMLKSQLSTVIIT